MKTETVKNTETSPFKEVRGFLILAAVNGLIFGIAHLAGLREYTTMISGTPIGRDALVSAALCVTYVLAYFGWVVVAPILVLTAAILAGWGKLARNPETQ
jgi:hypothetical protein